MLTTRSNWLCGFRPHCHLSQASSPVALGSVAVVNAEGRQDRLRRSISSDRRLRMSTFSFAMGWYDVRMVRVESMGLSAGLRAHNPSLHRPTGPAQGQVKLSSSFQRHTLKLIPTLRSRATIPLRIISKRTAAAGFAFTTFMSMAIGVHVYYLPFYFQSVLGTTAAQSGIRTLPYLMTLLLAPMISGALITLVGHYVPFMWAGSTLTTIGSGLLFTLSTHSSTGQWVGYQFLAAFGAGICRQIPFSAVPLVLADDDLAIASALVAFCNSLGPTLAIGIGQSIFTSEFLRQLAQIPGIDGRAVMNAGAANLGVEVPGPLLEVVREAFDYALTKAFVVAIASAGAALCCSLAMEWLSVKKKR